MAGHSRLLLELERKIKQVNLEIINPVFPDIGIDAITPVMGLAARSRAAYLKGLFDMVEAVGEGMPTSDQINKLKQLREAYEELVSASQALETAIQRGYLDVKS